MFKKSVFFTLLIVFLLTVTWFINCEENIKGNWFIESVSTPKNLSPPATKKPLVIAIVDDGIRITHQDLKKYIWNNPFEIPKNNIDDDGNGYVDDKNGWDISDNNNIVVPPEGRLKDFYHGTHLAGIIAQILSHAYGDKASDLVKILPVKCLSDTARDTYLKDGYKGIEYAIKSGADIILCAWVSGFISQEELAILDVADKKGIFIVASAGNFPEGRKQFPAAFDPVIAVAALGPDNVKIEKSNYGTFVDLSAPGINVSSTSVLGDKKYEVQDGSSVASAIVAAGTAILKVQYPLAGITKIEACLKNSADSFGQLHIDHVANLGAGKLNIKSAVECELCVEKTKEKTVLRNPQGFICFNSGIKTNKVSWIIKPDGKFKGLRFNPVTINGEIPEGTLSFYSDKKKDSKLYYKYRVDEIPDQVFLPSTSAYILFEYKKIKKLFTWFIEYRAESINYSTLYCSDTRYLELEGTIEDGSGPENYSHNSSCKWLITAPVGKVIRFKFSLFDTEARIDKLYFFNGAGTHEDIMAIFSGPTVPPVFTTWRNQVLVWFVSDGENQGKGWKAEYEFIEPEEKN